MKLKQLALASSLFFSCHLAIGATYDLPNDEQFSLPASGITSTPGSESDNGFFDLQLPDSQAKSIKLKRDYLEAFELLKTKQLIAAESKINALIKQYPKESEFYNLQASLELLKNKPDLAIKNYQQAVELNPTNIRSHLGLTAAFFQAGKLSEARQSANEALSIDDKTTIAYILLAKIAYQENRIQDIENILLTAQSKAQGEVNKEIIIADNLIKLYLLQKKPKKALSVAKHFINRHPENSSALALLAKTQIANNQTAQATQTLEKLVRRDKQDIQHRFLLAKLLINDPQKKHQTLKLLDEIDTIAPENIKVQAQRTVLLTRLKQFPKAMQATQKVKQLSPDTGLAEALEGEIYLAEKKQDLALPAFEKSYAINPNTKVLSMIVNIMMAQNKQTDAINFLVQALKKNPKNLAAHFNLGNIYQRQNNNHEAEKHYLAILAEQPNNAIILNNLAWIYHLENNPKALEFAEKAYQKAPKSAAVADTYAVILKKQGDLKKALKIFEQAASLAPNNYDIQYHLADAYAANGETQKAISILKKITRSEQNFPEKNAAMELLNTLK